MRGVIGRLFGGGVKAVSEAVVDGAGAFVENAEAAGGRQAENLADARALAAAESASAQTGRFNAVVDGLSRLPRPLLALGTLGLFVFAMVDPDDAFTRRMEGLGAVPEPLWWLLGAVVSFYFVARELHHHRRRR